MNKKSQEDEMQQPQDDRSGEEGASGKDDFIECLNLRGEVWDVMCNIDGLKQELLQEYEQERIRRDKTRDDPRYDGSHEQAVWDSWCKQFNEDPDDTYNEEHGGFGAEGYLN
jgi:hypothetical protein